MNSCIDCGTDWTEDGLFCCPLCSGGNIVGVVVKAEPKVFIAQLSAWVKKVNKLIPIKKEKE